MMFGNCHEHTRTSARIQKNVKQWSEQINRKSVACLIIGNNNNGINMRQPMKRSAAARTAYANLLQLTFHLQQQRFG